jgi:hypothetical protein
MLIAVVFAVLALALWFPETRIGGALRRLLIDEPARRSAKVKRGHVLLVLLIAVALAAAYAVGRQEGVAVAGQASGDFFATAMTIDFATWLDVTAIAAAVAATVRFREALRLAAVLARQWARRCAGLPMAALTWLARGRARRTPPAPRPRQGEDPDRPAPAFSWA